MAELCFQPGKIVLPGNGNLCLKRSELIGRPRGPDEGPMTAIDMLAAISGTKSLAVLDGFARNLWADWADGKLTDDQAGTLAETLELRKREVRGVDTVAVARAAGERGGEGAGAAELFPGQAQRAGLPKSTGFHRAAADAGGLGTDAASSGLPVHDGRAGGAADRRRRGAGPQAMPADLGRDRGAGRGGDKYGAQRFALRRARRACDHRGAAARQAAEPLQCGADRVSRVDSVDRTRAEGENAGLCLRGGRVQKNRVHG